MIKRIFLGLSFLVSLSLHSSADWKIDIAEFLDNKNDYQGAASYLLASFEKIDEIDKPLACGLLAFSFNRLNDKSNENQWIKEYFETYKAKDLFFDFLTDSRNREIIIYLAIWKTKYPFITEIALIERKSGASSTPPLLLEIGIDITNDTYYKLSDTKGTICGGLWQKGLNLISIMANHFFDEPGSHLYFLEVKAGDILVRKEIEIHILMTPDLSMAFVKKDDERKSSEYKLSMYVGNQLIFSSKKFSPSPISLALEIPPLPPNYKPFDPPNKSDPIFNSFSIFDALGAFYQAIKDLKTKKSEKESIASFQKKQETTINFLKRDSLGFEKEVKAIIKLKIS